MTPPVHTASEPVELLPCPFCGEAVHIRKGVNGYGHCKTDGCYASRAQIVSLDDQKQVAAWNRRALTAAPVREEGGAAELIEQLRQSEGAAVTILCDNPDFNDQPNSAVEVVAYWTNWQTVRFTGHNLTEALRNAASMVGGKVMGECDSLTRIKLERANPNSFLAGGSASPAETGCTTHAVAVLASQGGPR